ncbi:hypothetical protein Q9L58_000066 [Maublancomyces gigas]|uniref:Uncharacterized protein n=1 Tax=Discina gigas TaxID=1032678 RepID=A0ABR3GXT3_9PEZI
MKTSIFSILSVAACLFSSFVVASPAASPSLMARDDSAGQPVVNALTTMQTNANACHKKWTTTCSKGCSTSQIISWQAELAIIIQIGAQSCKDNTPKGFVFGNPKICLAIIADILLQINICLTFLLGQCGLLGGLLSLVIALVLSLLGSLTVQLNFLTSCLSPCIPGVLGLVTGLLGGLLGGATCFVCSLI